MARKGDVIENPVSGETFTFLQTSADTEGRLLRFELLLRPGGRVPTVHLHTRQEERFDVIAGTARVRSGKAWRDLVAGESAVIPAGTAHVVQNETDEDARVVVELRPAMRTEVVFETLCGLARDGKVSKRGLPNPLRVAVVARGLGQEDYLPGVPVAFQRLTLATLAPVGKLLGYKARYAAYSGLE